MSSTAATSRLHSITSHITTSKPKMPPITCHVLDTSSGAPAAAVPVTLSLLSPSVAALASSPAPEPQTVASATTNADGRIGAWSSEFAIENGQVWKLRFETWEYFKGNTFFPYVEVTFVVDMAKDGRQHYHVPVLLAPWSYSTYRGS